MAAMSSSLEALAFSAKANKSSDGFWGRLAAGWRLCDVEQFDRAVVEQDFG
jgi:hypothetical protein